MKTIVVALFVCSLSSAAAASPCSAKIATLQSRFAHSNPAVTGPTAGDAAESTAAKLHRQPTAGSVENGERSGDTTLQDRQSHFEVAIEEARAADDSGDASGCEAKVREAERALGR